MWLHERLCELLLQNEMSAAGEFPAACQRSGFGGLSCMNIHDIPIPRHELACGVIGHSLMLYLVFQPFYSAHANY